MKKIALVIAFVSLALLGQAQSLSKNTLEVCFETAHSADSIISKNPDIRFKRVIPPATNPVIEERHRRAGLDLWYIAEVVRKDQVDEQVKRFKSMPHVRKAYPTVFKEYDNEPVEPDMKQDAATARKSCGRRAAASSAVDDPLYYMQWHYSNSDYANINLEKAWETEPGKRNVVVAVLDGKIDYTHPDLAQNMWVNEAEKKGLPGVDDDGNGYVDDIYGLDLNGKEEFADHGTHIAGTIAAVNNNGIGVCGVAGGDGVNTGVKVMSIAIMSPSGKSLFPEWLEAKAFVYAADNGAVIASNSWGSPNKMPSAIHREGIRYFQQYAGCYEGSPMKGGLVLFASGNDNKNTPNSPFNDSQLVGDNMIIVAASASNGLRSSFSNYGPWVDITAPGGDWNGRGIYSTFPDNKYGYMNGTSMATPHVSGVAALVVSKFASPTLTPGWVKKKILDSANSIDTYQAGYSFVGQMGAGLLDAYRAVCSPAKAPQTPTDFKVVRDDENQNVFFYWTQPADADGNSVSSCAIYPDGSKIPLVRIQTAGTAVGDTFSYYSDKAGVSQSYQIKAIDVMGNESELSAPVKVEASTHLEIFNPYHTSNFQVYRPYDLAYFSGQAAELKLKVIRPIGSKAGSFSVDDPNKIVSTSNFGTTLFLDIKAKEDTPIGRFPFSVTYYDRDNPEQKYTLQLTYTVEDSLRNNRGIVAIDEEKMHYYTGDKKGSLELQLRDYIHDAMGVDFVIVDVEEDNPFEGKSYKISNDVLKAEYDFEDIFESSIRIPIWTYNTFFEKTSIDFYIHYCEPTGIKETGSTPQPSAIYTPTGIRVKGKKSTLSPGMYIMDGRKVIIR